MATIKSHTSLEQSKHLKIINKNDERLRKTTIAFLKDFAEQGYENAVECIDWLEKQWLMQDGNLTLKRKS